MGRDGCQSEGLQRATMKDGRRLRQAGSGSRAGAAGEAGAWEGCKGGGMGLSRAGRRLTTPAGATGRRVLTVYSRLSAHRQFLEHEKPPHTIVARGLEGACGSRRPRRGWAGSRWILTSWAYGRGWAGGSGSRSGSGLQCRARSGSHPLCNLRGAAAPPIPRPAPLPRLSPHADWPRPGNKGRNMQINALDRPGSGRAGQLCGGGGGLGRPEGTGPGARDSGPGVIPHSTPTPAGEQPRAGLHAGSRKDSTSLHSCPVGDVAPF